MTRQQEQCFTYLGKWCEILQIENAPTLHVVPRSKTDGADAVCEYYDALETGFVIKIAKGPHVDLESDILHELMHVRTGCTDQIHETWIRKLTDALLALDRAKR